MWRASLILLLVAGCTRAPENPRERELNALCQIFADYEKKHALPRADVSRLQMRTALRLEKEITHPDVNGLFKRISLGSYDNKYEVFQHQASQMLGKKWECPAMARRYE